MALCDALGFNVERKQTQESIYRQRHYDALGLSFHADRPKYVYEYKLVKKDKAE